MKSAQRYRRGQIYATGSVVELGDGSIAVARCKTAGDPARSKDWTIPQEDIKPAQNDASLPVVKHGTDGAAGQKGEPGKDGVGIATIVAAGNVLSVVLDNGDRHDIDVSEALRSVVKAGQPDQVWTPLQADDTPDASPIVRFRGFFAPYQSYRKGDVVRRANALMLATKDIAEGSMASDGWSILVPSLTLRAGAAGGGTVGPQGPKGDKGDPGPAGPAGADGQQGPQGIQGPKGDPGQDGAPGPAGADGTSVQLKGSVADVASLPTGAAAGDLYVVLADGHGYVWDGGAWKDVGPIQGPAGAKGDKGDKGDQGDPGQTGAPGADGQQGPQGIQGPKGDQGDPGPAGADSTVPGPKGDQGIQGAKGDKGDKGDPGASISIVTSQPDDGTGTDGDFALMTMSGYASLLYQKQGGTWVVAANMMMPHRLSEYQVASLPVSAVKGQMGFVTDGIRSIDGKLHGGGSDRIGVFYDGTAWVRM